MTSTNHLTVLLWRHAPTPDNERGRLQGRRDTPTHPAGLEVGRAGGELMLGRYGTPREIWSSPLQRASETAQLLTDLCRVPWSVDEQMTQRSYGVWEGLTVEQLAQDFPEELAIRNAGGDPDIPGWETGIDVGRRVAGTVTRHVTRVWENDDLRTMVTSGGPLVFVSHGSAIAAGARRLLNLPEQPNILGHINHAHWVELRYHPDGAAGVGAVWTLQAYNVGPH